MNQLEQLEVYLKHLGRPYVIKDVNPKDYNKVRYTDADGKDSEAEYTKVITIDSPESVKDYYPRIDLWYIPSVDKFVDPSSATNGETNDLQADTAKDVLDYVGFVYWEMEDLGDQLDNVHEDTEKRLDGSKKESKMKTYECSMQKKIESLAKKRSEKRTVTKSYDVYKYDELSDDAKAKVKDMFLQWRGEDGDMFKEDCENSLADLFPNSDLKVQYSLTYSQGDGFNTYGTLNIKDLLNADFNKYPLNGSGITAPANKDAILAACEKADVYDINLEENRRYGYSLADSLEVIPNDDENLTDEDTALLSDLETFAREVMEEINSKFEKNGYDYFYEMDEDEVRDMADANDYEFTEDGELA